MRLGSMRGFYRALQRRLKIVETGSQVKNIELHSRGQGGGAVSSRWEASHLVLRGLGHGGGGV